MKQHLAVDDQTDKLMGRQLTAEYKHAVAGMTHVIRVGAMVMMLRARLLSNLDNRTLPRGRNANDTGLNAWLEKYAPEVKRSTAYRFEDVAKAVAQKFALPSKVAKRLTFEQLVAADPKKLDPAARKAQAELLEFVQGTSQRSWLDQFRSAKDRGGKRARNSSSDDSYDPNSEAEEARDLWLPHLNFLESDGVEKRTWKDLPKAELDRLIHIVVDLGKQLRERQ